MVGGFNHNFNYKGQVYHVQTEDSGVKNPHIITLLYRGGTILSSKKTSYADIIKIDHLEEVVEELMKSQHREMLRHLKNGDLDELLGLPATAAKAAVNVAMNTTFRQEKNPPALPLPLPPVAKPKPMALSAPPAKQPVPSTATLPVTTREASPTKIRAGALLSPAALTLDDIILSYMVGEENKK